MLNVISHPLVIVLLFLVPVLVAYLIYRRTAHKAEIDWLIQDINRKRAEIRSLKACIDSKEKGRKLYTFESGVSRSGVNRIENVVAWREISEQLRLTLDDGSLCVLSIPPYYKLIVQDQSEEGTK